MIESKLNNSTYSRGVFVPEADADLIKKIYEILGSSKNVNVEIKKDSAGKTKVLKVLKEIA